MCRVQCAEASWQVGRGQKALCTVVCSARSEQRLSALCSVQSSVFSVQCAVFSVQCAVCSVQCAVRSAQSAVCGGQCSLISVECAMGSARNGSVPYEVWSVHSAPLHSFLIFCFAYYFTSRLTIPILLLQCWLIRTINENQLLLICLLTWTKEL
jgi:hypothetical protein